MNTTFFGTDTDIAQIWQWLFEMPGMRIFEEYSVPDQSNRWFETWSELERYLDHGGRSLAAWPESVGSHPRVKQVVFTPETQQEFGATGRTILQSPALITVVPRDVRGCLAEACIMCWSEQGARQRSSFAGEVLDEVDWAHFKSITSKVRRAIGKAAPAKLRAYPIMPDAFEKLKADKIKLWFGGEVAFPSPLITLR